MSKNDDMDEEALRRCKNLKEVAEDIRRQMFHKVRSGIKISYENKIMHRYSQEEMIGEIPGYKSLLANTSKKPLRLEYVDAIATYLCCNTNQRNSLRIAAGYLPVPLEPEGEQLQQILAPLRETLYQLPYPGYIVLRNWNITDVNDLMIKFLGMKAGQAKS